MLRTDECSFLTISGGVIWFYYIFCGTLLLFVLPYKVSAELSWRRAVTFTSLNINALKRKEMTDLLQRWEKPETYSFHCVEF